MNGFRKNKGIVLELTSLLDVIMIMLFWVMTDVSASADSQKEDAKAQVQAVTQQLEEQKQKSADELENLRKNMQKQIDEAYKKAENINSNAAKNQQALDGYTQGMLISLDMQNENGTDKLYISRNDEDIMTVTPDEDISGRLISLFEGLGAADGEVMLAAVVYDGDAVLYRNMRIVEKRCAGCVRQIRKCLLYIHKHFQIERTIKMSIQNDVEKLYRSDLEKQRQKQKKKKKKKLLGIMLIVIIIAALILIMQYLGLGLGGGKGEGSGDGKDVSASSNEASVTTTTTAAPKEFYDIKVSGSTYIIDERVVDLKSLVSTVKLMSDNVIVRITDRQQQQRTLWMILKKALTDDGREFTETVLDNSALDNSVANDVTSETVR